MSELDWAELSNFQNLKTQLERAHQTGLSQKIPFLDFYKANVESHINFLQPNGLVLETDEEKRKKNDATNVATAAAAQRYEADLNRYITRGFETKDDLFNFAEQMRNENFREMLDGKSDEEKHKIAQNVVDSMNKNMDSEEKKKYLQENRDVTNFLREQNVLDQVQSSAHLEKLKKETANLIGDDGEAVERLQGAYTDRARKIDNNESKISGSEDERDVVRTQTLAQSFVDEKVNDSAQARGIANIKSELAENKADILAKMQGVDPEAMAAASKAGGALAKQGGDVKESDKVELQQIAQNQSQSKDMDLSFLS